MKASVIALAFYLLSTSAMAADFNNRWWPVDMPIPKSAPSSQMTTTTTTTTPDKTTTVTTTVPWGTFPPVAPSPPVAARPIPHPVQKAAPPPVRRYRQSYDYDRPTYNDRYGPVGPPMTDLSVPADRVNQSYNPSCNGVACY